MLIAQHDTSKTERERLESASRWLWIALTISLVTTISGLGGCATVLMPPSSLADPVSVFVIDHGRTSSLAIPSRDGGMLRYAYGDWNYYALGKSDVWHGIAALLWPTQSGLGRGALQGPVTADSLRRQIRSIESIHAVRVERSRVLAFERKIEALFDSRRGTKVENHLHGMSFVQHPQPYTYLWNSNHAVASWLRELGCQTRGLSFHATWRVASPEQVHSRSSESRLR